MGGQAGRGAAGLAERFLWQGLEAVWEWAGRRSLGLVGHSCRMLAAGHPFLSDLHNPFFS